MATDVQTDTDWTDRRATGRSIQVDWEPLARTAHPLRIAILEVLGIDGGRAMSPNEVAFELQLPLNNVNYHVKALFDADLIVLVRERPLRGTTEHFYALPAS